MYVIRDVMHCKPGQVKTMVDKFRELSKSLKKMGFNTLRIMTDVSGERYWTVVSEQEVESMDAYAEAVRKSMSDKKIQKIMEGYHDLVEAGHRQIFHVE